MGNTKVFLLPDLGEGLTEADLVSWLVAVGDEISVDQPIAEVETAKSMVEVPSPYAGTVEILHGQPGETLDVGKPLISVRPAGAPAGAVAGDAAVRDAAPREAGGTSKDGTETGGDAQGEAYREEEKAGSGNVLIGYGTPAGAGITRRTRAPRRAAFPAAPEQDPAGRVSAEERAMDDLILLRTRVPGKLGAVISPLVRRMAKNNGVDLGSLNGSGDRGLILRRDVEAAMTAPQAVVEKTPEAPTPATEPSRAPEPSTAHGADVRPTPAADRAPDSVDARTGLGVSRREPVKGIRKAVAANMTRSRKEIPEATVWVDVDATALLDLRASLKAAQPESTPGLMAFLARFVTAGLKRYPELNTRIVTADDGSLELVSFDGINLGFAAQTDRGLVVPSIRRAESLTARELDGEIRRLTAVVRESKATPQELGSGTFTLNNYGVFGVDGSAAIINHPEVAILGIGRIIDKPWVVDGQLAVRKVTELTLTFDHRVCDGGTAGGFLRFVADAVENPMGLLTDL